MLNMDWKKLRARLHHDWLQRLFAFLSVRARLMDKMLADNQAIREDLISSFMAYEVREKLADFSKLVEETESALSPTQLLYIYPLDIMQEEDKKWLGEMIHALYVERTKIKHKSASLANKLHQLVTYNDKLQVLLTDRNSQVEWSDIDVSPFWSFYTQLQEFSKMISALPHEVQVV